MQKRIRNEQTRAENTNQLLLELAKTVDYSLPSFRRAMSRFLSYFFLFRFWFTFLSSLQQQRRRKENFGANMPTEQALEFMVEGLIVFIELRLIVWS